MIFEIAGLPGSGKSTVAASIRRECPAISLGETPYFRRSKYYGAFLANGMRVLPTVAAAYAKGRTPPSPRDVALMAILTGWHKLLRDEIRRTSRPLLLDEGPVCYMTRLNAWGADGLRNGAASDWWARVFDRWSRTVDLVLLLEAPMATLLRRIRAREAPQEAKNMPDPEAFLYLERLAMAQEFVIGRLTSGAKGPALVRFDSAAQTPDEIAREAIGLVEGRTGVIA